MLLAGLLPSIGRLEADMESRVNYPRLKVVGSLGKTPVGGRVGDREVATSWIERLWHKG